MTGQFRMHRVGVMALALAGLALPVASYAQDKPDKADKQAATQAARRPNRDQQGEAGAGLVQRIQDQIAKLDLTEQQKTEIEKILAGVKDQVEALRADARANKVPLADLRDRMQTLLQETRQKTMQVLTPEQRQKVREQMAEVGPLAILERLQKVAAELNLTDDQKTGIQAIVADAREQAKGIREKAQADRQAAMQDLQKLLRESREKIVQLLTPEQSQKLTELLKDHPILGDRAGRANRPGKAAGDGQKAAQ
jgi:Spy/CpxP family protein refolding chaperone